MTAVAFTLRTQNPSTTRFGPRLGQLLVTRQDQSKIELNTPGFFASTSRGVVPHLSRDHTLETRPIRGVHITYESFMELAQPLPPQYPSQHPLHDFMTYTPSRHIVSLAVRDPSDLRLAPPNQVNTVQVWTNRGVRKTVPSQFHQEALKCRADILEAINDNPLTAPPFSQKRLTKAIERTSAWLVGLLKLRASGSGDNHGPAVLVQMVGGASLPARKAFADSLREHHDELGRGEIQDSLSGFAFDLAHLRNAVDADTNNKSDLTPFLHASLDKLSVDKMRIVRTVLSPHHILVLLRDVGIDVFDTKWASEAAQYGVAFDFTFPARTAAAHDDCLPSRREDTGLLDIGHNLYAARYAHDHTSLTSIVPSCECITCTPIAPTAHIAHSTLTDEVVPTSAPAPYKRSYLHHLLRTHEMTAHAFLVAHNIYVLDMFFEGIRRVLEERPEEFAMEVERFEKTFDGQLRVIEEGRVDWKDVDLARGRGRLAREKVAAAEADG